MGITDKITGRVKQAAGDLTDDADTAPPGHAEERKGEAQGRARARPRSKRRRARPKRSRPRAQDGLSTDGHPRSSESGYPEEQPAEVAPDEGDLVERRRQDDARRPRPGATTGDGHRRTRAQAG